MKKIIIILIVIIIVAFAASVFLKKKGLPLPSEKETYSSEKYGISFTVPEDYVLTEAERGSAHREHHNITLVKKEDAAPRSNSEGPTAITIDIYQNNLDQQSLSGFFYGTNDSNSKLMTNQSYASTTVAGKEAITYKWSGLYEADAVIFAHNGNIIMMTVTHISPEDPNIAAFQEIRNSIQLKLPKPLTETEAVSTVKNMYHDLADYPSDNLPPKRIQAEQVPNGDWRIGFLSLGSGRPGILRAECYSITPSKEVKKIGEFTAKTTDNVERLDLATCKAVK